MLVAGLLMAQIAPGLQFNLVALPVVELTLPAADSTAFMPHPHFRWLPEAAADRYEIQIATDPAFQTLQDSDSIPVPRYIPLDALPAGQDYWWRVRVKLRGGRTGDWSSVRKLTVNSPVNQYQIFTNDSLSVITNTIALAASNTPARLVFATGTYRLALPNDAYLFKFNSKTNLIIDGGGSLVIMENNNSGFSSMTGCRDMLLRNFAVDYMTTNGIPVTHTAGRIVSTQSSDASIVFQVVDGYLPPDDPRIRDATLRRWGCLMDTNTPGRLKNGVSSWFDFQTNVTSLGSGQYRLYLTASHAGKLSEFNAGDTLVKSAAWGEYVMEADFCTNITYSGVTSYAGGANHFSGSWNDAIHFLRCASRIKAGRLVSNPCGGYGGGTNYRTGFWMEECLTEGLFDDSFNCSSVPVYIYEKLAANVFFAVQKYPAPLMRVGEHLTLYNPPTGATGGTFEITNLVWDPGVNRWAVTVDGDLGEVFPGSAEGASQLYIQEQAHQYGYVRNNTFRNSRRFGGLFRSHDSVIEGNTFAGLGDCAIRGVNETGAGLDNLNVRILNNLIMDCGYSSTFYNLDSGAIHIAAAAYQTNCTQTVHRNIEITGNTVYDWDGRGVVVENAQNVLIFSNTVKQLNATNFYDGGLNYGIYLNYTDGAEVSSNDLRDTRPVTAAIFSTNSTDLVVSGNLE
jgi:hypothetical protein